MGVSYFSSVPPLVDLAKVLALHLSLIPVWVLYRSVCMFLHHGQTDGRSFFSHASLYFWVVLRWLSLVEARNWRRVPALYLSSVLAVLHCARCGSGLKYLIKQGWFFALYVSGQCGSLCEWLLWEFPFEIGGRSFSVVFLSLGESQDPSASSPDVRFRSRCLVTSYVSV